MSQQNRDLGKLNPSEAAAVRNLRQMDQRARSEMFKTLAAFAEAHPVHVDRPALRLVHSNR